MPYTKTDWEDFPSTATPIDAEALNKLESQYDEALADVAANMDDTGTPVGSALSSVIAAARTPMQHTFSHTGVVSVKTGTHKLYNDTGKTLTIVNVRATVDLAPTGASLIVDVHKNGTTIFTTQSNRPTIAATTFTDTSTPAVTTWAAGEYLTVDIDQVGSTVAGSDLVVTVVVNG